MMVVNSTGSPLPLAITPCTECDMPTPPEIDSWNRCGSESSSRCRTESPDRRSSPDGCGDHVRSTAARLVVDRGLIGPRGDRHATSSARSHRSVSAMNLFAGVPPPAERRLAVRVTKDALRQIAAGHPWVFDRSILSVGDGSAGDLAVIFNGDRRFAAIGLFDPTSPIRIRILHHGQPTTIDTAWWTARIVAAAARREPITASGDTTGYRLIHGENDGFSGLVLDRYDTTLVVKLYSAAWVPHLPALVPLFVEHFRPAAIVLRLSRGLRGGDLFGLDEGMALFGDAPTEAVLFRENGLVFEADVIDGQKTGHFLDQRENRNRVRSLAQGKRVLDVFACTGGFSVHAAAGGATTVHSVDLSAAALATARRNMEHNLSRRSVESCAHTTEAGDAFDVMRQLRRRHRRFDIVVVDPPSFARKQSDHDRALHAYGRLTREAIELVEDDGVLVQSSCSSRIGTDEFFAAVHAAAGTSARRLVEMVRTGHPLDHPIAFAEGAYLKTLFARVRP